MAPYRNSRTGARSTRSHSTRIQIDHDVFEGLPVRHWRKRSFHVNAAPEKDINPLGTGTSGWPELPMPRDAHMYSPMSEALLRAARMVQIKKPATPLMDDDKEPGEDDDADSDLDMGFVARRWAVVPKDKEGPEPEFLAKRRRGLSSIYTGATGPLGNTAQMRITKIRKLDTEGNSSIWEVLVPVGQAVEGEIVEEETSPTQAPAPGTVVEGLGVVNAEGVVIAGDQAMPTFNRRRPPRPKRKAKGSGRGRRKKRVAFKSDTDGAVTANGVSATLNGSTTGVDEGKSAKMEHGIQDGDTEMGDENVLQEGEEGSEEGSEGDEGEDGDREEGELSPSPTPAKSPAEPPIIVMNDSIGETAATAHDAALSPLSIPVSSPAEPAREYSTDPMLLDLDDDEPISHPSVEHTATSISENIETMPVAVAPVAAEALEKTIPSPDPISRPLEAMVEDHHAEFVAEPQAGAQKKSMTTSPPDTTLQPLPEPVKPPVTDEISESLAEHPKETLAESLTRPWTEPMSGSSAENVMEGIVVSTAGAIAGQTPSAPADLSEEAVPEPTSSIMSAPVIEAETKPRQEAEVGLPFEPPTGSVSEPVEQSEPLAVQSTGEQYTAEQFMTEPLMTEQSVTEQPVIEQSMTEQPVTEQSMTEQPVTEQSMTEQPTAEQSMTEQSMTEQSMTKQSWVEQSMTEQPLVKHPLVEQPITEQPTTEQSIPEQSLIENSTAEQPVSEHAITEPWAKPATEPFPEAISPERRFSYTRATTSPQAPTPSAPTPSPPTPIESTFGLKAPYLSPKAPTMSPPTPIERSMSSSPDIPLADERFRLPPQIDAAQEVGEALAPDIPHIPGADAMSVEAASNPDTRVNAQVPVEHDSLDGKGEPRVAEESEGSTQHVTDGEEDVLGSLLRSLEKHDGNDTKASDQLTE